MPYATRIELPWRLTAGLILASGLALVVRAAPVSSVPLGPASSAEMAVATGEVSRVEEPPLHSTQLAFVIRVGGASYMTLDQLDGHALPAHGRLRTFSEDGIESAVARVADADVPELPRAWAGREVIVDGKCHAKVTGFAVIARLTGDPAYAGLDGEHWTASTLLDKGNVVLAGRLDRCNGTYARDAALPAIVVPEELHDPALASKARAIVMHSDPAHATQREWREMNEQGAWADHAAFYTRVLRHPVTGVTWVSVHAWAEHGCGDPEINVWGLFRVEPDGSLATVQLRKLELDSIDQLIDVDGDGSLEIVGKPWLGLDRVLERADGDELQRLELPFYGCPC